MKITRYLPFIVLAIIVITIISIPIYFVTKSQIKLCTEMTLPQDLKTITKLRSMNKNTKEYSKFRAIFLKNKQWPVGSEIKIGFLNSPPWNFSVEFSNGVDPFRKKLTMSVKEAIKEIVMTRYQPIVNLKLIFVPDNEASTATIRIYFDNDKGSSSYIGRDNLYIPSNSPTMRFAWYDTAVVLHEFGHALGMGHEHLTPYNNPIEWNLPKLYDYYAGYPNYWDKETVDFNVVDKYKVTQVNGSDYDNDSIMRYSVPSGLTKDGKSIPETLRLSQLDVLYLSNLYPGATLSPEQFYFNVYKEHITKCLKGYYNQNYTPNECPGGSYCLNCEKVQCPGGKYCPPKSVMPISCPGGSYCTPGSAQPVRCSYGTYCPPESSNAITCPPGVNLSCLSGSSLPTYWGSDLPLPINTGTYAYYFDSSFSNDEGKTVYKLDIKNGSVTTSNIKGIDLVLNEYVYLKNKRNIWFKDISNNSNIDFKEIKNKVWAITDAVITKGDLPFEMSGTIENRKYFWKYIGANNGTTPFVDLTKYNTNWGRDGDILYLAVKYEEVDPKSSIPVLVNLTADHFRYKNSTCPGKEIRSVNATGEESRTIDGNGKDLLIAGMGTCRYTGICVKYESINKITDFISSVMISSRYKIESPDLSKSVTYKENDIDITINLDKLEIQMDMHAYCGDGIYMYLVYGKNTIYK